MANYDEGRTGRSNRPQDNERERRRRYGSAYGSYDDRESPEHRESGRHDGGYESDRAGRGYGGMSGRYDDDLGRYGGGHRDQDDEPMEAERAATRRGGWFGAAAAGQGRYGRDDRFGSEHDGAPERQGYGPTDIDRHGWHGGESPGASSARRGEDGWYGNDRYGGFRGAGNLGAAMAAGTEMQRGNMSGKGPKGYARSDDRIKEDVCDCLTDDRHLDASSVEVQVEHGEVTLTGSVDSREAKRHAEDLCERVSGVKHVQNNLRVQTPSEGGKPAGAGATANRAS